MLWDGVTAQVAAAKAGDAEALQRLYRVAQPYLLRLAQKTLGPGWPDKSVSDLTQETWVRAWEGIGRFQGAENDEDTGALFRAWLARTMKNVWLNQVRFDQAKRRQPANGVVSIHGEESSAFQPAGCDPTPSQNVQREEGRVLLEEAVAKLPEAEDRDIVRLRFFDGLSFTDIGRRLGRDESTIRYRLQRVLEFLGEELRTIS